MEADDAKKRKRNEDSDDEEDLGENQLRDAPDLEVPRFEKPPQRIKTSRECPYLSTVNRDVLDFDFERLCSVTLSPLNVYCCLVCGKYYTGRAKESPAMVHSVAHNHHVFINLENGRVYCLPDNYEVIDPSLEDIKFILQPHYTAEQITALDRITTEAVCVDGTPYLRGVLGLNNVGLNDSINCVIQALSLVGPLRDYFLMQQNYRVDARKPAAPLVERWGELVRKLWSSKLFRAHVSPHELLQQVSTDSEKRFRIGHASDPMDFLAWFINSLSAALPKRAGSGKTMIHEIFQGEVMVTTETTRGKDVKLETSRSPYLYLTLDIPPPPLFKSELEANAIPQIPLLQLLSKFNGEAWTVDPQRHHIRRKYSVLKMPRFVIFHMRRFMKNNFFLEKNPTIVNFPIKGLNLSEYLADKGNGQAYRYNLVASIKHEGDPLKGTWSIYILHKATDKWFEVQDLVVQEVQTAQILLSEAYIQIYERVA